MIGGLESWISGYPIARWFRYQENTTIHGNQWYPNRFLLYLGDTPTSTLPVPIALLAPRPGRGRPYGESSGKRLHSELENQHV